MRLSCSDEVFKAFSRYRALESLDLTIDSLEISGDCRSALFEICSHLRELRFGSAVRQLPNSYANLMRDMLSQTANLRLLSTWTPIGFRDLMQLMMKPNLRVLDVVEVTDMPNGIYLLPPGAFKQLNTLYVADGTHSARPTRSMLNFQSGNSFRTCWIEIRGDISLSIEDYSAVFYKLKEHKGLEGITFHIGYSDSVMPTLEQSAIVFGILQTLSQIKRLYIGRQYKPWLPLNTAIMRDFLESCPRLEWWGMGTPAAHSMPFDEFLDLLQNHRFIQSLPVSVFTEALPTTSRMLRFGKHNYGPRLLISEDQLGEAAREVITQVFPCVTLVLNTRGYYV
jgi:hypothetical protein